MIINQIGVLKLIILGIDPGYAIVGYGAIAFSGGRFRDIGHGAILTNAGMKYCDRIDYIYENMEKMLHKCRPDAMAIEKLYFQNNHKTAIDVAQARGVILLAAKRAFVPIYEYTPLQVKTAVTGYGKAKKPQVMEMTKRLLRLSEIPKPDDTADALAIAICHAQSMGVCMREAFIKRR